MVIERPKSRVAHVKGSEGGYDDAGKGEEGLVWSGKGRQVLSEARTVVVKARTVV